MRSPSLHGWLDDLAVWREDRVPRSPQPLRLAAARPLSCFGALPALPSTAPRTGRWSAPAPRPLAPGDRMSVLATPAAAPRRGTALLVPPWKIASPSLVGGYVQLLARRGLDVWLVCPPHHLWRTQPGARSGEAFVSLDVALLRASVEALVLELRVLVALAAARGPVGLVGLSLGALAGALAATAPERLEFAALVGPADLARTMAETRLGRRYQRLSAAAGAPLPDAAALAAALSPFDPSRRAPSARRVLVAAGTHDRIVPLPGPIALARAWGVSPALYERGHLSLLFLCRALRRDLDRFVVAGATARAAAGGSSSAA